MICSLSFTFKGAIMISMVTLTTGGLTNQLPAFIVRHPVWSGNTLLHSRENSRKLFTLDLLYLLK